MSDLKTNTTADLKPLRIITQKQLSLIVPYTPQHIRRLEKAGKFPSRIKLGQNRVGWRLLDVESWIEIRMATRISVPGAHGTVGIHPPAQI